MPWGYSLIILSKIRMQSFGRIFGNDYDALYLWNNYMFKFFFKPKLEIFIYVNSPK